MVCIVVLFSSRIFANVVIKRLMVVANKMGKRVGLCIEAISRGLLIF